jgi:hypothetical protein
MDALDARQTAALQALKRQSPEPLAARFERGQPAFLRGRILVPGRDPKGVARAFLDLHGAALYRLGPNSELRLARVDPEIGLTSFAQRYRGLPVIGARVNVLASRGAVHAVQGALLPADGLETVPRLADRDVRRRTEAQGAKLLAPPQLVATYLRGRRDRSRQVRLAYSVPVAVAGRKVLQLQDAHTGEVFREMALEMDSAASEDEYEAEFFDVHNNSASEGCEGDGDDVDEIGDDDSLFGGWASDAYAWRAWFHSRRAYSFYYDRFGRLSYDGSDGPVLGYVRSSDTDNAQWSRACEEISWADGYGSTDTPVHELSHGVTQFTSGLEYEDESGALNESFSDVMAAIADPENDWLHGEDGFTGGPLRSLRDPKEVDEDYPDRYSQYVDTNDDNGGVHTNSSIPNKAAFLLSQGGAFNGRTVNGIGRTKAGKLLFKAYTSLTEYADFLDLRDMAVALATIYDLNNWHGFTAADVCSTRNAYAAVEIGGGDADCDGTEDGPDPDSDNDGDPDASDNCRLIVNPAQTDKDNDGLGDACDDDDDGDSVPDVSDNCPAKSNPNQADIDDNGIGDACEDPDGDAIPNGIDNCPSDYNPFQQDTNGEGTGDACDPDPDQDGVFATDGDNCPLVHNPTQADGDGDFFGDACDGCPDTHEIAAFGLNQQPYQPDSDGDGTPDACDNSITLSGQPVAEGIGVSPRPRPGTLVFERPARLHVPLAVCPPPCAEAQSAPLVGGPLDLELAGLAPGVTPLVVDRAGQAWARSTTLRDGTRRLRFVPQGDQPYFLAFDPGPRAPAASSFELRRFVRSTPLPPPVDLAVSVTDDVDPAPPGSVVTYAVDVRNESFGAATDVVLAVEVPRHTTVVSSDGCRRQAGQLRCALGTLPGGRSLVRRVRLRMGPHAGAVELRASVSASSLDPEPASDAEVESTTVVRRLADLRVQVSDTPDPVRRQALLAYDVVVENLGPHEADHVGLADLLPDGLSVVSLQTDRGECRQVGRLVACGAATLGVGETMRVRIEAHVGRAVRRGRALVNRAGVGSFTDDPSYGNNVDVERTRVD